jgi:hypothetical protein
VITVDTGAVGEHDGTVTIDSDAGSASIRVAAQVGPAPLLTPEAAAPEGAKPGHSGPERVVPEATRQDPVSPSPVMAAPSAGPGAPAPSRASHAVRRRWVLIATGAAITAVIGIIAATLLLPGKPDAGIQTLNVAVAGPLGAIGGMPAQVLQNDTTLTRVASGTLSPNTEGTELEWNTRVSPGTYQVCVEPPGGLRFTETNTHVRPGWFCSLASVAGGPTSVVFHIAA